MEWCAATGIRWSVTTNGSALSAKNARRLADARPLAVNISVDGATEAVHDHSRGIAGSLQAITRGIETLRTARSGCGASFAIRIKPTVHRGNFREMPVLVRWAEEVGATSIDFSPVLFVNIYGPLRDPQLFSQVRLDPDFPTLVWPNQADFDLSPH